MNADKPHLYRARLRVAECVYLILQCYFLLSVLVRVHVRACVCVCVCFAFRSFQCYRLEEDTVDTLNPIPSPTFEKPDELTLWPLHHGELADNAHLVVITLAGG